MNRVEICHNLVLNHQQFGAYVQALSVVDFHQDVQGTKWNAGQHADHILKSTRPLLLAFGLPSFVLKLMFGKANRKGRSFEELFQKYTNKLQNGARASGRFVPKSVPYEMRDVTIERIVAIAKKLAVLVGKKSEAQLDELILPHPLLGKITLREMLYFTIFHVKHHQESIQNTMEQ